MRVRCLGFTSGRRSARSISISSTGNATRRTVAQRERMVGRSSPGFSARMMMWTVSGGSSRTLRRELAASFMKLAAVRKNVLGGGCAGKGVRPGNEGGTLPNFEEDCGGVGGDDEAVGVGLDED